MFSIRSIGERFFFRKPAKASAFRTCNRLFCERLEDRLPPGDLLFSALLSASWLKQDSDEEPQVPAGTKPVAVSTIGLRIDDFSWPVTTEFEAISFTSSKDGETPSDRAESASSGIPFSDPFVARFAGVSVLPAAMRAGGAAGDSSIAKASTNFARTETSVASAPPAFVPLQPFAPSAAVAPTPTYTIESVPDAKATATASPLHYNGSGQDISLTVRPDRVGVALKDGSDEGIAKVTAKGGVLEGLSFVRRLTDNAAVFEGPGAGKLVDQDWSATPEVNYAVPVYVPADSGRDAIVLDEVIVALKDGVSPGTFFKDARFADYRHLLGSTDQYVATLAGGHGQAAVDLANALPADERVAWANPNFYQDWQKYFIPNDPRFGNEWHHLNTGQAAANGSAGLVGADSRTTQAWDIVPGGSPNLLFGIVDDGIDIAHPDLKIWTNAAEAAGQAGVDDDGNGYIDDVNGWNFITNTNAITPTGTGQDHATSVSGVAAARGNNGIGVAGAAYNASVFSARVFSNTSTASDAGFGSAIRYAAGLNGSGVGNFAFVDLTNNSWGGGSLSTAISTAFTAAGTLGRGGLGTLSMVASGNSNGAISNPATMSTTSSAVVAVGATNNKGTRSNYSNYGAGLDFVTPSNDTTSSSYLGIDTTDRLGTVGYNTNASGAANDGDYTGTSLATGFGGTSSATPLATGIAGLVLTRGYDLGISLTPTQLKSLLRNSTDLIGSVSYTINTGKHNEFGFGRLNAYTAVNGVGKAVVSVTSTTADITAGTPVSMGSVNIGSSSSLVFRVRNQGTLPLTLSGGSSTGPFSISTTFGATTLNVGDATTFTARFSPTAGGAATGTVSFNTNDPARPVVTLNLTGTGTGVPTVQSVIGKAFEDWNGDGIKQLSEPALVGATVYVDTNTNGTLDGAYTATGTTLLGIPDNNTTGVSSSQVLSGLTGTITDVNVTLNVTHSYVGDLRFSLVSPAGTTIALVTNRGTTGDNFTNTTFDDSATTAISSITSAGAPFTGSYRPEALLSGFNGQTPNGTWQLKAIDSSGADLGFVNSWTLSLGLGTAETSTTTAADGSYSIAGLVDGTYTIRVLPAGYGQTNATQTVTVVSGSTATADFGAARNNRIYGRAFNDANDNGTFDSGEAGIAGRTAFLDSNGNGLLDTYTGSFTNSTTSSIPDNNATGATSNLAVSGLGGVVKKLTATVTITHANVSQLRVTLISPSGTRVPLAWNRGLVTSNYTATVFDDAATTAIGSGTAPFTGTFKPESPLSAVIGQVPNGTWKMEVVDASSGTTGTLNSWSLAFTTGDLSTTSDAQGNFSFDVPAGTYALQAVQVAGSRPTTPVSGVYNVTVAGTAVPERHFGFIADSTAPALLGTGGFLVNGGEDQRSLVTGLRIEFTEKVSFSAGATAAFTLIGPSGPIPVSATVDNTGPRTVVSLSFTLTDDGNYSLAIDNSQIRDLAQNLMGSVETQTFFRLFGDLNGDRSVDVADFLIYRGQIGLTPGSGGYLGAADFNADGSIDVADFILFRARLGSSVAP